MKSVLHLFNTIYNILFRIITFMTSFYIFSSLLFLCVPYHIVRNSDVILLSIFAVLCLLSYVSMKKVISTILQLTK